MVTTLVMSGACKSMVSLHARVYNSTRDAASSWGRQAFRAVRMSVLKSVRFIDAYLRNATVFLCRLGFMKFNGATVAKWSPE